MMTNREWLNTLSTKVFVELIMSLPKDRERVINWLDEDEIRHLTKEEFKELWEKFDEDDLECITYEELRDCYERWGLDGKYQAKNFGELTRAVLKEAKVTDMKGYDVEND